MANVIDAIIHIVKQQVFDLRRPVLEKSKTINRVNLRGVALEDYVKELFAGIEIGDAMQIRHKKIAKVFSYFGNVSNPPDAILKNGDAIEIKKIEKKETALSLNSSYPKSKLYRDDLMLNKECKQCEEWIKKDILYVIGVAKAERITSLFMVYGEDYCASKEVYEQIKQRIKNGVEMTPYLEFTSTKELGRLNRVDPLGITYLRIRGMWGIENPFKVFDYLNLNKEKCDFEFVAVINDEKFETFSNRKELVDLAQEFPNLTIENVEIKDPNNPAKFKLAKLIKYNVNETY